MPGKPKNKLKYLENINPFDFPFLIADILTLHFHHTNVKVVDGTGDGKRDVFSLDKYNNKVITQCKFHIDPLKTSGTKETDEIVLALHKFKYNSGIFCTSGKLSPQSKREYLDNYPDFQLQWLEGHEIVDIVLSNNILRKIWFENEKIHLTSNTISVPFLLRKLPEDIAIEPDLNENLLINDNVEVEIKGRNIFNQNQFRPLNSLDIRNAGNTFGNVFAYEAVMSGKTSYNSITEVKEKIIEEIQLKNLMSFNDSYLALRFGIPYFKEDGDSIKKYKTEKFNLPINSETFIIQKDSVLNEYDFLIEINNGWEQPYRIHMSQLSDYCYYNKDFDFVFYLFYNCTAKEELHPHVTRNIEIDKIIWQKSLFISGQNELMNQFLEKNKTLTPDKLYPYGPNGNIACWMHPKPFMYSADLNEFEKALFYEGFEKIKKQVLEESFKSNLEIINWEIASKVAAINNEDPFPSNPETSYRIVDIFEEFHNMPSPIKPDKREFIFECVWAITNIENTNFENQINAFSDEVNILYENHNLNFMIDNETNGTIYMRVTCNQDYIPFLSTDDNLKNLTKDVQVIFNNVENVFKRTFPETRRATNTYWFLELGIFLYRKNNALQQ